MEWNTSAVPLSWSGGAGAMDPPSLVRPRLVRTGNNLPPITEGMEDQGFSWALLRMIDWGPVFRTEKRKLKLRNVPLFPSPLIKDPFAPRHSFFLSFFLFHILKMAWLSAYLRHSRYWFFFLAMFGSGCGFVEGVRCPFDTGRNGRPRPVGLHHREGLDNTWIEIRLEPSLAWGGFIEML